MIIVVVRNNVEGAVNISITDQNARCMGERWNQEMIM